MRKLIYKPIENFNWFLGLKLFKNANYFSINLFNYFYKKYLQSQVSQRKFVKNIM